MATHRRSILGPNTIPDTSGKCWQEPYTILATNDVWGLLVYRHDENGANNTQLSTRVGLRGGFKVPKEYVGTPKIIVTWTATVTTGNRVWDFDYRAVANAESLDQTGNQESVTVTTGAPAAANNKVESALTLTAANLAVDDFVEFELFADGTDASDTLAAATLITDVEFEFTDV